MNSPGDGRAIEHGSGWLGTLRWGVAAIAVLAVHGAAAYALLNERADAPPQGAEQAPILIDLAPPAAAPEIAAVEPTPEPVAEPQPEPEPVVEETPPPPEIVEPLPEPEPEPAVPEPEPIVEPPEEIAEPVEETPPEPVVEETPPEPEVAAVANAPLPTPRPAPPRREPPRETRTAERRQAEPERPRARREAPREEARPERRQRQAAAPSTASQGERRREASQGSQRAPSVSPARWQSQVQARLNRFKRTPRGGGRGTAQVSFAMDANGRVTSVRLTRSAGSPALDEAAVSLVRRASPFPAPPGGSGVTLNVPIRFD